MEWVETTGESIEQARAKALDLLNVDMTDAEIEVVDDVKKNLFGRVKTQARVRARIKPKAPEPRDDRRGRKGGDRKRGGKGRGGQKGDGEGQGRGQNQGQNRDRNRSGKGGSDGGSDSGGSRGSGSSDRSGNRGQQRNGSKQGGRGRGGAEGAEKAAAAGAAGSQAGGSDDQNSGRKSGQSQKNGKNQRGRQDRNQETTVDEEFSVEEQQEVMNRFVGGVAGIFDPDSTVETVDKGDDVLEAQVSGEDLGLLVGPAGATLAALEDLTRTAMQRAAGGRRYHRIHVDVDQYKDRRRGALAEFAQTIARDVIDQGERKAMEPMGAADRKVVHDALTEMEGVSTLSEGDDPRRRVVIVPE